MIKAIIFDFDDTLVRTAESKWAALQETGRRHYTLDISEEHIKKHWGKPYLEMLSGVFMDADDSEHLRRNYEQTTTEFPMQAHENAPAVLAKLAEQYKIGILTASSRKLVLEDLEALRFPIDKMIYIQTAEDTTVHKPDPAVFEPMLQRLHSYRISRDDTLYIGDSRKDYEAAKGARLHFLGIAHARAAADVFQGAGIPFIGHFDELQGAIVKA